MDFNDVIKSAVADAIRVQLPLILAGLKDRPNMASDGRRMLTINELRKAYRIGRAQVLDLINAGKLPARACVMRGGRQGWRVRIEDAERVLAGSGV